MQRNEAIRLPAGKVAILLLAFSITACQRSDPSLGTAPSTPPAPKGVQLAEFPAAENTFRLAIGECNESACPIQVELITGHQVTDTYTLPVESVNAQFRTEKVDENWGAESGLTAWATGEEGNYVSTTARTVRLASDTIGLVVSQLSGFEHLNRHHTLLLARDGKLVAAWQGVQPEGPAWAATEVTGTGLLYIQGFDHGYESQPDTLSVVSIVWNPDTQQIDEQPLPNADAPVYLVSAGTYATDAEARSARGSLANCLPGWWAVLDAHEYSEAAKGTLILGRVFAQREAAERVMQTAAACDPSVKASMREVQRRGG